MIKGIIFDLGGVLLDNPASTMKSYLSRMLKITDIELSKLTSPVMPDFQKGLIDEGEFWKRVTPNKKITTSIWTEAIKRAYSPKTEMFSLVSRLKDLGLKLGILSNTEIPVVNFLSGKDFSLFDILLYSCLEGTRKPEREIYLLAINRMKLEAKEIIFIDDSEENILVGQEFGLHCLLFESPTQVRKEIERLTGFTLVNDKY